MSRANDRSVRRAASAWLALLTLAVAMWLAGCAPPEPPGIGSVVVTVPLGDLSTVASGLEYVKASLTLSRSGHDSITVTRDLSGSGAADVAMASGDVASGKWTANLSITVRAATADGPLDAQSYAAQASVTVPKGQAGTMTLAPRPQPCPQALIRATIGWGTGATRATATLKNSHATVGASTANLATTTDPMDVQIVGLFQPSEGLATDAPWDLTAIASDDSGHTLASIHRPISFIPGFATVITLGPGSLDPGALAATVDFEEPPLPPSHLTIGRDANDKPVLTWQVERGTAAYAFAPSFMIYRAPASDPTLRQLVYTTSTNATSFTDYSAIDATAYVYWVQAVADGVTSTMPDPLTFTP